MQDKSAVLISGWLMHVQVLIWCMSIVGSDKNMMKLLIKLENG